jgi:ubiquinone/menaquinone biosynthesis C-methylase UbiE
MQVNTTYEPYSQEPEYIETNRLMLQTLPLDGVGKVLDLACGTGLLTDLLLQIRPGIAVVGIDLSAESLDIGRRLFSEKGLLVNSKEAWEAAAREGRSAVRLIDGSADVLDFPDQYFDFAMIGNAIHLMPDQTRFLKQVHRVLRPGANFCFNSVFFVGTYPQESEAVYAEWMKEAVRILQEKNEARRAAGLAPIARQRGKAGRAFDKGWKTPEQWAALLGECGFDTVRNEKRLVPISQRGLELVGAYGGLAEVLMSGYPIDIASECLQEAVGRAFSNVGISEVGRYWLELVAQRR